MMPKMKQNGTIRKLGEYDEIGNAGLEAYSGYVTSAYNTKLHWPGVEPLYSRIWRSDPEVTITRHIFSSWSSKLRLSFELPETVGGVEVEQTDDDKRALEFAHSLLEDVEGGINWLVDANAKTPFYGWGWWETPLGLRSEGWEANEGDGWESGYNDGLVGVRRFAFRDYSSFSGWDMDDNSGRPKGFKQQTMSGGLQVIPVDKSLHLRYGDMNNPEGLAVLESLWRLERIKYGLEVIFGIGSEHTAGHLSVTVSKGKLSESDKAIIRKSARAIMTAQEGNYATWTEDIKGEIIDSTFSAASDIFEAIKYYGILKLQLLGMQWVALSATTGSGSYSAMNDSSSMALMMFNAMTEGNVRQCDEQVFKRLFNHPVNKAAFPNMTRRPRLKVETTLEKDVPLDELIRFAEIFNGISPLGSDDIISIRRKSGVLSETLPEDDEMISETEESQDDNELTELAKRPFAVSEDEEPTTVQPQATVTQSDVDKSVNKFLKWARENDPVLAQAMSARVADDDTGTSDS